MNTSAAQNVCGPSGTLTATTDILKYRNTLKPKANTSVTAQWAKKQRILL